MSRAEEAAVPPLDSRAFRNACGAFGTGVTVVTTRVGEVEHGMTANAFMSISLEPPLVAVSIGEKARMLGHIRSARRFAVSILRQGAQDVALHFAGRPNDDLDLRFRDLAGLPVICGSAAAFAATVTQEVPAGDHVVFFGRVERMAHEASERPLMFHAGRFGCLYEFDAPAGIPAEFAEHSLW